MKLTNFGILFLMLLFVSGCFKRSDVDAFYQQYWLEIRNTDSTLRYPSRLTMLWPVNQQLNFVGLLFDAHTDSAVYEVRDDLIRDTFTLYYKSKVVHTYRDNYKVEFSNFKLGNRTFKNFVLTEPSLLSSYYGPLLVIKR